MVSETKQPKPKLLSGPILRQKLALSQQPVETIAGVQRDSSWSKLGESLLSVQPSFKQNTRSSLKRLAQIERLLPILDVHGASRAKLFKAIYEKLFKLLGEKLQNSNEYDIQSLNIILEDSLREHSSPLIFEVLQFLLSISPKLNNHHLEFITNNISLYKQAPLAIKKKIWLHNRSVFLKELVNSMNTIIAADQDFYRQLFIQQPLSKGCILMQRQEIVSQEIAKNVSNRPELLKDAIEFILESYKESSQDCIYPLFLFFFCHQVAKQDWDESEIIENNVAIKIVKYLNQPSSKKGLSDDTLQLILKTIEAIDENDIYSLKLAYMIISSPMFLHLLSFKVIKIFDESIDSCTLPRNNKSLYPLVNLLEFGTQVLNTNKSNWDINQPHTDLHLTISKLIPVLVGIYYCIGKKVTSNLLAISLELKTFTETSNSAVYLIIITLLHCLKKLSTLKNDNTVEQDALCTLIQEFLPSIKKNMPLYVNELMSMVYYISKIEIKHFTWSLMSFLFVDNLFLPWLKTANYPSNFIVIKILNHLSSVLSEENRKLFHDIASELDHDGFC